MADTNLRVAVTTTADLTGLKQVQDQVRSMNTSITEQLAAAGVAFDPVSKSFKSVTVEAAATNVEVSKLPGFLEIGRFQAAALSREIANGALNARTLGVSLASLGGYWSVAAIGAFTLFEVINKQFEAQQKLNAELAKQNEQLAKTAENWERVAAAVNTEAQLTSLAESFRSKLEEVNTKLTDAWRTLQGMSVIQSFFHPLAGISDIENLDALRKAMLADQQQAQEAAQAHEALTASLAPTKEEVGKLTQQIIDLINHQATLNTSTNDGRLAWIADQEAIRNIEAQIQTVKTAMKSLDDQVKELNKDVDKQVEEWEKDQKALESWEASVNKAITEHTKALNEGVDKQIKSDTERRQRLDDYLRGLQEEAAIQRATGDDEATVQTKVDKVRADILAKAKELGATDAQAKAAADNAEAALRQQLETRLGMTAPINAQNQLMREAQQVLSSIRQQQELIKGAPFMGADEKSAALLTQQKNELAEIGVLIKQQETIKGTATDPEEIQKADAELQKLVFNYQKLHQEIVATQTPMNQLRTNLQSWANSFGTTMTQISHTIEEGINTGLQSLNTYLVTGKFNAQQLLQSIEMLGLKLIEQLVIQRVMAAVNATAAGAQAATEGPIIAAAYAPAATAVTIATSGEAAAAAPAEYALALGAIQAMAVAQHGGQIPGTGSGDHVPVLAEPGEFMIRKDSARKFGYNKLQAINRMQEGGQISTWADYITAGLDTRGFQPNVPSGAPGQGGQTGSGDDTSGLFEPTTIEQNAAFSDLLNQYLTDRSGFLAQTVGIGTTGDITGSGGESETLSAPSSGGDGSGVGGIPTEGLGPTTFDGGGGGTPQTFGPIETFAPYAGMGGDGGDGGGGGGGPGGFRYTSQGGLPPPGGWGGIYGGPTVGNVGDYFGRTSLELLRRGLDPSMGFGGPNDPMTLFARSLHINRRALTLPTSEVSQYFHGPTAGVTGSGMPNVQNIHFPGAVAKAAGGMIGSGGNSLRSSDVHVHNYTDLKALVKEMGSRRGRSIIVDTVRGHQIDLGIR